MTRTMTVMAALAQVEREVGEDPDATVGGNIVEPIAVADDAELALLRGGPGVRLALRLRNGRA